MESLLAVRGLKTEFATSRGVVHAVDGVDFEIASGEVLGLVGESGCGKSVTAFSIMYLVPQPPGRIVGGHIWFRGIDLLAGTQYEVIPKRGRGGRIKLSRNDRLLRKHRERMNKVRGRDMSMIFQEPMSSLNPVLPAGYQVAEVLMFQRRREICDSILQRKAMSDADFDLFRQAVSTAQAEDREKLLADFCLRTGLPVDKIVAILEESGMSLDHRVERLKRLEARRRAGNRWFLHLLRRLDVLESAKVEREWRRLLVEDRVLQVQRLSGTRPLSAAETAVFRKAAMTTDRSERQAALDEFAQRTALPRDRVARLLETPVIRTTIPIEGGAGAVRVEAEYRSRYLTYRFLMLVPFLRTWLMRPIEEEARRHVLELFKRVRIPEPSKIYHEYPHELSGGMQQRVMIAMALACDPALMIADEPTTSLDVTTQAQILHLIKDLRERMGSAILYITHDLAVVAEISDRVAVMYAGKIVEDAPVDELFAHPLHPYAQGLLDSIVSMDKKVEVGAPLPTIPGTVPDLIDPPSGCRFHPRCKFAFDRCRVEEPKLLTSEGRHKVACHLYTEEEAHVAARTAP